MSAEHAPLVAALVELGQGERGFLTGMDGSAWSSVRKVNKASGV